MLLAENTNKKNFFLLVFLIFSGLLALVISWEVFWTVLFAVTLAYLLRPLREDLVGKGFSPRISSAILTFSAYVFGILLLLPFMFLLFQRREILLEYLQNLPEQFSVQLFGFSQSFQTSELVEAARQWVSDAAVDLAMLSPSIALKTVLVGFVVYGILLRPKAVSKAVLGVFPDSLEEVLRSYDKRIRGTLYGLYVVQAATAFLTFVVALPVMYFYGYEAFFALALIAGILQFIPVLGPFVIISALSLVEVMADQYTKALSIFVVGVLLIGFLPDAIIRPRLAKNTTGLPACLYFLGFIGGVLTVGAIGIIVGPLSIALVLETIEQIVEDPIEEKTSSKSLDEFL